VLRASGRGRLAAGGIELEGRGRRSGLRRGGGGGVHAVARLELMGLFANFWAATEAAAQAAPVGDPPRLCVIVWWRSCNLTM
jgi:hypothetical protein